MLCYVYDLDTADLLHERTLFCYTFVFPLPFHSFDLI